MPNISLGEQQVLGAQSRYYRHAESFPDPFMDVASLHMPSSMLDALKWTEFLVQSMGTYRTALDRVVSYFLTDVEIDGEDREEKKKYKEFLYDQLGIQRVLHTVAMDFLVYGNSFSSVILPIRRYLGCGKCAFEAPLREIKNNPVFNFQWSDFSFSARCPACGYHGKWRRNDRRASGESDVRIKRWSPHEIDLLWDPITDDVDHIWKIPADYKKMIREGHLFHLERADWEVIEAIRHNQNLRFDKDVVYHLKEEALAGIRNRGWGISRVLSNFRQAWYVQVLHRYNEAIALDYVIPFRVLTPAPRSGAADGTGDPAISQSLGGFVGRVHSMIRRWRKDPAQWNVLPFPLQYQALGGDATQLAPRDLMDQGIDTLLNSIGVPVEFYKGSMTLQAAPTSLRLLESGWTHLVHGLNRFLQHVVDSVARLMSWEPVKAHLTRVTHADDLNKQMAKLQLMMGQQISQTTGLRSIGADFEEEQRRMLEEERFVAEEQAKAQKSMDQASLMDQIAPPGGTAMSVLGGGQQAQPGAPADPAAAAAGGGAPMLPSAGQPSPGKPQTPEEMMGAAQQEAQRLMTLPDSQRKSELIRLKRTNSTMHALVSALIDDIRRQAQQQGGAQVLQQQFGSG